MGRDYIPLLAFRLGSRGFIVGWRMPCSHPAVHSQVKLKVCEPPGRARRCQPSGCFFFFFSRCQWLARQSHLEVMLHGRDFKFEKKNWSLKTLKINCQSVGLEDWASDGEQEVPAAGRPLKVTDGNQEDATASLCPTCAAKEISVNANLWVEREEQMFSLHLWLLPEMVLL